MLDLEYRNKLKELVGTPLMPVEFISAFEGNPLYYTLEYRIWNPLIRVGLYALSHEKDFLSAVIDFFGHQNEKGNLSSYYTRRLDPKELFHCLRLLGEDCLWIVLETIKGLNIMDLEKLRDSIMLNDTDTYKSIMANKDVDTDSTTPICRLLYVSIRLDELYKWWEGFEERCKKAVEEGAEESEFLTNLVFEWLPLEKEIESGLTNIFNDSSIDPGYEFAERMALSDGIENSLPSEQEQIIRYYEKSYPTFIEDGFSIDDYYSYRYRVLLGSYCRMKEDFPSLSTFAKIEMEGILKNESFRSIWGRFDDFGGETSDILYEEISAFKLKHGIPIEDGRKEVKSAENDQDPFPKESRVAEPTKPKIERPVAEEEKDTPIPVMNDFIEQKPTKEEGHLYPDSKYGFIPENYFEQKIDKAHPDDHYNLVEEIQEKGEEQFFDFITYLVDQQYIENNDEQKALFAYRLTGRLRPKDDDLPPVWWSGKNNSPKELLYIIRYCVDFSSKKKFSKQMKKFFDGPNWPTKDYSTIADWADTPFREALHGMYEVCGLKYNQPKKKKKKY